jgi:hypothetical protein
MLVMYGANIITPISFEIHCYTVDTNSFESRRNNSQIQNEKLVLSGASSLKFLLFPGLLRLLKYCFLHEKILYVSI